MKLVLCVLVAALLPYSHGSDLDVDYDLNLNGKLGEQNDDNQRVRRQSSDQDFSVADAILELALDIGRCKSPAAAACSSNSVFSPLSIVSTLTMILMGAKGKSYSELRTALKYPDGVGDDDINQVYRFILKRMREVNSESITLDVINGLFAQKGSGFNNDYVITAKDYYLSEILQLDFVRDSFGATKAINRWVSQKTRGKITNILSNLQSDTKLVVANAVYFNGNWADPFSPDLTMNADFRVSDTELLSVPTMFQAAEVGYVDSQELGCTMIAIPYEGEDLGMFIIVPKERNGLKSLNELESRLNSDVLASLFDQIVSKSVSIQLPKFRIQQQIQLKRALRNLGVSELFSANSADLSRMMNRTDAALDNIVHQTFIEVSESGTEAAAATVVSLSRVRPAKRFVADQPFLFLIRDIPTKATLFWGRVVRPQ